MRWRLCVAGALIVASATPALSATWEGETTTVWPNASALCVTLPEKRSKYVSQMCFGLLGLKWQIGTFGDAPLASVATKWDLQPLIFLRDDDNAGQGRPIGALNPEVQEAFDKISITGIDLAVNVLPNGGAAAVGFGLLPHEGTLAEAGAPYPGNMPSAYSWDDFFVSMPEGDACEYAKDASGSPVYLQESVAKTIMKDGFRLANLSACGASFTGLGSFNTALKKSCQAWASDDKRQACAAKKQTAKAQPETPEDAVIEDDDTAQKTDGQPGRLAKAETLKAKPKTKPKPAPEPKVTQLDTLLAEVDAPDSGPLKKQAPVVKATAASTSTPTDANPITDLSATPGQFIGPVEFAGRWYFEHHSPDVSNEGEGSYFLRDDGTVYSHGSSSSDSDNTVWRKLSDTEVEITTKGKYGRPDTSVVFKAETLYRLNSKGSKLYKPTPDDIRYIAGSWTEHGSPLGRWRDNSEDYRNHRLTVMENGDVLMEYDYEGGRRDDIGVVFSRGGGRYIINHQNIIGDVAITLKDENTMKVWFGEYSQYGFGKGVLKRDNPIPAKPSSKADTFLVGEWIDQDGSWDDCENKVANCYKNYRLVFQRNGFATVHYTWDGRADSSRDDWVSIDERNYMMEGNFHTSGGEVPVRVIDANTIEVNRGIPDYSTSPPGWIKLKGIFVRKNKIIPEEEYLTEKQEPQSPPPQAKAKPELTEKQPSGDHLEDLLTAVEPPDGQSEASAKTTTSETNLDALLNDVEMGLNKNTDTQQPVSASNNSSGGAPPCGESFYASPEYGNCTRRFYNKEDDLAENKACLAAARATVVARNQAACGTRAATGGAKTQ